jgi:hypothetical protein
MQFRLPDIVREASEQSASPVQPANTEPDAGAAVSFTDVPLGKLAWQAAPHAIPAGSLLTVPVPSPAFDVASMYALVVGILENVAVQVRLPDIVTDPSAQSASPVQPAKVEPDAAVAVSRTAVPLVKLAWHAVPHVMPVG